MTTILKWREWTHAVNDSADDMNFKTLGIQFLMEWPLSFERLNAIERIWWRM